MIRKRAVTLVLTVAVLRIGKNVSKLEHQSKLFQANKVIMRTVDCNAFRLSNKIYMFIDMPAT